MGSDLRACVILGFFLSVLFSSIMIIEPLYLFLKELRRDPDHNKKHFHKWVAAYFLFWPLTFPITIVLFIPVVAVGLVVLLCWGIWELLQMFKPLYYEVFPSKKISEPGTTHTGPYR